MYGIIFANGDLNDSDLIRETIAKAVPRYVIAADGGLRFALSYGLIPDTVIGDLDSADADMVAEAEQHGAKIIRYPAAKDETDLELALMLAAQQHCNPIDIIGGVGDRLDQTLGNVYLLALPILEGCAVRLLNHLQTVWIAHPGEISVNGQAGDTLSLIPMAGEATGIVTDGLAYPLRHETLRFGPARGISNVFNDSLVRITFESGLLLIVHTRGRA